MRYVMHIYNILPILVICLIIFAAPVSGQQQYSQPKWFMGFEAEFSYSESGLTTPSYDPIYRAAFNPRLMHRITSRAAIGLLATGVYATQSEATYYGIGAGPIASLYLTDVNSRNVPYVEVFALYSHYEASGYLSNSYDSRYDANNNQSGIIGGLRTPPTAYDYNRFHMGFNIGILRRLSKSLALVTSAGFGITSGQDNIPTSSRSFPGMELDVGEQPFRSSSQQGYSDFSIYLRVGLISFL